MKYALRRHEGQAGSFEEDKKRLINVGDLFMCLSIKRIYEKMGIDEADILSIQTYEFESYEGEYIILPMNFYESYLRLSPRVIPVFLALSMEWEQEWSKQEMDMLRRFSPIGCRDERTMRELHKRGIDAYLNGCMVASFPQREENAGPQDKVFFVDAHHCIDAAAPREIKDHAVYFTHEYFTTPKELIGEHKDLFDYAQSVIDMYAREARMIVTSRFHGAVIALALGIPVILIMENDYFKYSWIKKYIPVYEPKDADSINWNPPAVAVSEKEKELMIKVAQKRISDTYEKYHDMCALSEMRERIEIKEYDDLFYGQEALLYIKRTWNKDTQIEYSFWGVTHTASRIYEYICANYPHAKLCNVYDMVVRNKFLGVTPKPLEEIPKEHRFIFVTADSAISSANKMFAKLGRGDGQYFCCRRNTGAKKAGDRL